MDARSGDSTQRKSASSVAHQRTSAVRSYKLRTMSCTRVCDSLFPRTADAIHRCSTVSRPALSRHWRLAPPGFFYFGGYHRKSPAGITSSRCLNGSIQCKNIDFTCDSFTHEHVIIDSCFYITDDLVDVKTLHTWTLM